MLSCAGASTPRAGRLALIDGPGWPVQVSLSLSVALWGVCVSSGKQAGAPASRPSSSDPSWLPAEGEPPVFAVSLRPYGPGDSPSAEQTLSYATLPLLKIGFDSRLLCIKCYEYSTLCPRNNLFSQICFVGKHLWTVGSTTLMVADGGQRILTPERYFNTGTHPASHVLLHDIIINTTFPVKLIENVVCCCCWLPVTPQTTYVTVPHDNMTAACVPATDVQDLHRLLVVGLGLGKHCDWLKITVLLL